MISIRSLGGIGLIGLGLVVGAGVAPAEETAQAETKEPQMAPAIETGAQVQVEYTLTVDGQVVDSSQGRGPLKYVQGQGQLIPGFERQLVGLRRGDERDVTVSPEEGYGPVNPQAFIEVPKTQLPADTKPEVGMMLQGNTQDGRPFRATISEVGDETVKLDMNHPLAGKTLNFHVKIVEVTPKS